MSGNDVAPPDGVDLPGLPVGWRWVYLRELLTRIDSGKNFRCEERPPTHSEYGIVKISAITWGTYDESESKTITENERVNLAHIIKTGDFLFSRANTIELVGACLIVHETRRRLLLSDKILRFEFAGDFKNWINWMLKSRLGRTQIEALATGNQESMRNIGQKPIGHICVPVPPANEQRRIVDKIEELFSELDKGVEALTTAREQLKAYRHSVLKHAFEGRLTERWRKQRSGELISSVDLRARLSTERQAYHEKLLGDWKHSLEKWKAAGSKGPKPSRTRALIPLTPLSRDILDNLPALPDGWVWEKLVWMTCGVDYGTAAKSAKTGAVPVIRMGNLQNGRIDWSDLVYTNDPDEIQQYQLQRGDVLFNRTNSPELVGKTALYLGERSAVFAGYLIRINHNPLVVDSQYLNLFLNSSIARQYGNSVKTDGVNQSNINGEKLQNYPFPFCSLAEQHEVVRLLDEKLSRCDHLISEIEEHIQRANALRQAILARAFSGRLVAHDPKDEPASVLLERICAERAVKTTTKEHSTKNGRKKAA
jgi:type I restriction enzyme, S subunit